MIVFECLNTKLTKYMGFIFTDLPDKNSNDNLQRIIYRFWTKNICFLIFVRIAIKGIILMKFQQNIKLIMNQINNFLHFTYPQAVDLAIKEAITFLEGYTPYSYIKQALNQCRSFQQIFTFLVRINKADYCCEIYPQTNHKSCDGNERLKLSHKSLQKSKLSTLSTSSERTNKSTPQSTLIQQIQKQQETIEQLKSQLQKTEKMVLICRRLEKQAYRSIDQTIDLLQKKEDIILKNNQERQILLTKIRQRDELLEQTLSLLQNKMR